MHTLQYKLIAGIVVAASQVDIDAGKLAGKTSGNAAVKAFARQMITDHGGVNKQALALVKKLKLTPRDSELGKSLKQGGSDNLDRLKALEGKALDQAYVAHLEHAKQLDASLR